MIEIKMTTKQAESLEQFVEEHMYLCQTELMGDAVPDDWTSFSPYCGCGTCETREYLMATFSWLKNNNLVEIYVEDVNSDEQATLF